MKIRKFAKYYQQDTPVGTERHGNILISIDDSLPYDQDYAGVKWISGPDEDLGYIIALPETSDLLVAYFVTQSPDDNQFIALTEQVTSYKPNSASDAKNWLLANGYWTSY